LRTRSTKQRTWNEELKLASDPGGARALAAGAFFSDGYTDSAFVRLRSFVIEKSNSHNIARDFAVFGEAVWKMTRP